MTARLISCALLAGLSLGCATSNDTAPTELRSADAPSDPDAPQARAVVLEGDLDPETVEALAKDLEGLAEVHAVAIAIHKTDEGHIHARLTLGGFDMPSTEELQAAITDFGGLPSDVAISFDEQAEVPHGPVDANGISIAADETKTPEEIEADVIDKLRADGVEGDIHVDVIENDGERRVEVRVERHEGSPE